MDAPSRAANNAVTKQSSWLVGYSAAVGGVALTTLLIWLIPGADHIANISLLYLLAVIVNAYFFSRGAAVFASVLAALCFDWFFVSPRYTFTINNPTEWLTMAVLLFTAMVVSQLTYNLRLRAGEAHQREVETAALAQVSWAVASQVSYRQTLEEILRQTTDVVRTDVVAILIRGANDETEVVALPQATSLLPDFSSGQEVDILRWVWSQGRAIPSEEMPFELEVQAVYAPLLRESRVLGALYLWRSDLLPLLTAERRVIESLANQAAVALERDRLSHAEAVAEALLEADKLKSALLSMISHDFRSPLAAIKASVTGLLQEGIPWEVAEQRELLRGIDGETDRLNRMVGDILALSRLEAQAWRPQREMVSVAEVVGVTLDAFSDEENERIQVFIQPRLPEVALDSVQIVQVLHNLLENALKYSPHNAKVDLSIAQQKGEKEDWLVVEVRDRGAGLPIGEEEKLFEKFYRARRWRESALSGTGIGLAICRGLVEAHGGTITAQNSEEGGALFRVLLPILVAEDAR